MDRKAAIEKIQQYAELIKNEYTVKMVILFGAWLEELAREDDPIEVAVIFDSLEDDYLEVEDKLQKLGWKIDNRIEPTIIETEREDMIGFLEEVKENGHIIYRHAAGPHAARGS